jgi:hypothetical protein
MGDNIVHSSFFLSQEPVISKPLGMVFKFQAHGFFHPKHKVWTLDLKRMRFRSR